MLHTKARGHDIFSFDGEHWFYNDDAPYDSERPCPKCNVLAGWDDPDPCLGLLPGVEGACCGHGHPDYEYVLAGSVRYDSVAEWHNFCASYR